MGCPFSGGRSDNAAFLVGGTHVFRFPQRKLAGQLILTELATLASLPLDLPLPTPRTSHRSNPTDDYPFVFMGYPLLAGDPACHTVINTPSRQQIARPLAEFLKALHAINPEPARAAGVRTDELRRLDLPYRHNLVTQLLKRGVDEGWIDNPKPAEQILEDLPLSFIPQSNHLVHGDLYACHILVSTDNTPTGIIDWGDAHLGDIAVDLGVVEGFFPPRAQEEFFAHYGEVDAPRRALARLRALQHALVLIPYSREKGWPQLEAECRTSLGFLASS